MTDQQLAPGAQAAPLTITLDTAQTLLPKLAFASFDGSGAAGDFLPVIKFVGPGNIVAAQAVGDVVTAGASVDQTWFRGLAKQSAGGITATTEIAREGGTVAVAGTGVFGAALPWAHSAGDALLDYTVPAVPTVIEGGLYVVSVVAAMLTPASFSGFMWAHLGVDTPGAGYPIPLLRQGPIALNGDADSPEMTLTTPPISLAAGAAMFVQVAQTSGSTHSFGLFAPNGAVITKLG